MKIGNVDVVGTAKTTFKKFQGDELPTYAAAVAYNVLFSVVPLLIFLTALSGAVGRAFGEQDTLERVTNWLFDHLPANTAIAVRDPIEAVIRQNHGGLLSVGALLALWGGRNAIAAVMKALNVVFDAEETRPWVKRNAVAIGLTVAFGLAFAVVSAAFLVGAGFAQGLSSDLGVGGTWRTVWSILRWPLIAVVLGLAVAALYWAAPNVDAPFRWLTPGAVLTVVLWAIASLGLGFYFANFAGFAGAAYGVLGGLLAFVFWLYVMSLILLIGAELNAVVTAREGVAERPSAIAGVGRAAADGGAGGPKPAVSGTESSVPRGTYTGATAPSASQRAAARAGTFLAVSLVRGARLIAKARPYRATRTPPRST
jgi:membrane protein